MDARRRRADAARSRRRCARPRQRLSRRRRRGDRDLLPARLSQSRARTRGRRRSCAQHFPTLHVSLSSRGRGRDPRIRARQHHLRQRLRAAAGRAATSRSWNASCARAASAASCASCTPPAGSLSPETARGFPIRLLEIGPAGGGLAAAYFGAAAGTAGRDLLRHGRHHGEGLPDRERRADDRADDGGGARAPVQARLRPADQGAGHRHDRDRRRRRLDRARSTRSGC